MSENLGTVLFVDDDELILDILEQSMEGANFKIYLQNNPQGALEILQNNKIDIIVSDINMPKMNGIELLQIVKKKHPFVHRIILSGDKDNQNVIEALSDGTATTYFTKPWKTMMLRDRLDDLLIMINNIESDKIFKLINTKYCIPSLPDTIKKVQIAIDNYDSIENIITIIKNDISFTSRILQIANSAMNETEKLFSIKDVITIFGVDLIKEIMVTFSLLDNLDFDKNRISNMLINSYQINQYVKRFYQKRTDQEMSEKLRISLMLMNIGKFIGIIYMKAEYNDLLTKNLLTDVQFYEKEMEMNLEFSHTELGAYLLSYWQLPDEFMQLAFTHHELDFLDDDQKLAIELYNYFDKFILSLKLDEKIELNNFVTEWITLQELEEIKQKVLS